MVSALKYYTCEAYFDPEYCHGCEAYRECEGEVHANTAYGRHRVPLAVKTSDDDVVEESYDKKDNKIGGPSEIKNDLQKVHGMCDRFQEQFPCTSQG